MTDARPLHDAPRGAVEAERNAALSTWYVQAQRQFPWRETGEPYPILVSEIMLQQTQASRVVPFFDRFMAQFPSVEDLAAAPLSDVLGAWSGLGYNRRARSLHAAAHQISTNGWPATIPGLMELPGIGPYTARAVACFAFGHDEVPVDTNLRRVLSRWHGEPMEGKVLQQIAEGDSDPRDRPGWVQAVMDLGATICVPRSPGCSECPVASWCSGPETYVPPRSQPRFEGSARQLRGAIVRNLVAGPASRSELIRSSGFPAPAVDHALADLTRELLVEVADGKYRIRD